MAGPRVRLTFLLGISLTVVLITVPLLGCLSFGGRRDLEIVVIRHKGEGRGSVLGDRLVTLGTTMDEVKEVLVLHILVCREAMSPLVCLPRTDPLVVGIDVPFQVSDGWLLGGGPPRREDVLCNE